MIMENELTLQLGQLHVLAIEFGGDGGFPVFLNVGKFPGDVDSVHDKSPITEDAPLCSSPMSLRP